MRTNKTDIAKVFMQIISERWMRNTTSTYWWIVEHPLMNTFRCIQMNTQCLNDTAAKKVWFKKTHTHKKRDRENQTLCIHTWSILCVLCTLKLYEPLQFDVFFISVTNSFEVRAANSFFVCACVCFILCLYYRIMVMPTLQCSLLSSEGFVDSKWNELLIKMDVAVLLLFLSFCWRKNDSSLSFI